MTLPDRLLHPLAAPQVPVVPDLHQPLRALCGPAAVAVQPLLPGQRAAGGVPVRPGERANQRSH